MICVVSDCDRHVQVKYVEMCERHYRIWRRNGDPTVVKNPWYICESCSYKIPMASRARHNNVCPGAILSLERLLEIGNTVLVDGCMVWTRNNLGRDKYGSLSQILQAATGEIKAHRAVLAFKLGRPLSTDECALHTCDNPPCVNPDHLFVGTNKDNVADSVSKGRRHGRKVGVRRYQPDNYIPQEVFREGLML